MEYFISMHCTSLQYSILTLFPENYEYGLIVGLHVNHCRTPLNTVIKYNIISLQSLVGSLSNIAQTDILMICSLQMYQTSDPSSCVLGHLLITTLDPSNCNMMAIDLISYCPRHCITMAGTDDTIIYGPS